MGSSGINASTFFFFFFFFFCHWHQCTMLCTKGRSPSGASDSLISHVQLNSASNGHGDIIAVLQSRPPSMSSAAARLLLLRRLAALLGGGFLGGRGLLG